MLMPNPNGNANRPPPHTHTQIPLVLSGEERGGITYFVLAWGIQSQKDGNCSDIVFSCWYTWSGDRFDF